MLSTEWPYVKIGRRSGKVRRPKANVLTTELRRQPSEGGGSQNLQLVATKFSNEFARIKCVQVKFYFNVIR